MGVCLCVQQEDAEHNEHGHDADFRDSHPNVIHPFPSPQPMDDEVHNTLSTIACTENRSNTNPTPWDQLQGYAQGKDLHYNNYDPIPPEKGIFYDASSLYLVSGYSRNIHPDISRKLPEDIIIMIWTFSTQSINTIKFGIVKDKLHHIYDDLVLSNCKRIVSTSGVLKLTVLNDLILDNNSEIRCDFGVVVLLIYGDLCIKRDSQIVAEGNGNIYIKTFGSLVMESSTIRTYNAHEALKAHEGNIDIKIEKDVKMTNNARMESGDIKIECDGSVQMDNVYLTATRNNICVKAKEELNVDMKWAAEHMSARMYKLFVLNSVMKIVK
eukprot:69900_1